MMIATHWGTNQVDSAVIDQLLIVNEVLRSEKDEIILQLDKAEKEISEQAKQQASLKKLEAIAARFKSATIKASMNGYGQDDVHHDDSWIDELDDSLRSIQLYDAKKKQC